jgi:quinol monooxygenase YgiN
VTGYIYLWEFIVAPEHIQAFEQAYGPDGDWVHLFRRASGYLRSELIRDRANPPRYLTIDYWESAAAYETFRSQYSTEFATLDSKCAAWTTTEREMGQFTAID